MQSETGFPSSHQLKSYVAYKSRLKLAARAVLSVDAGLLVVPAAANKQFDRWRFLPTLATKNSIGQSSRLVTSNDVDNTAVYQLSYYHTFY